MEADVGPIGPAVDTAPAEWPGPVRLNGSHCRVEKLDAVRHGEALWRALKDHDRLWDYMADGPFGDAPSFLNWIEARALMLDPYSYAVVDKASGRPAGIVTLMEIRPSMRAIEMGNIVYAPILQRTAAATEAQYLMARYVFEDLHYRRYEWKCDARNEPSKRAAKRLGFSAEGTFRKHMIVKGRNRDTAWFAMTDDEWPSVRAALDRWLAAGNFDSDGRQKVSLAAAGKRGEAE